MRRVGIMAGLVLLAGLGVALWVRVAPVDPEVWHDLPESPTKGVVIEVEAGPEGLAELNRIALATPRTQLLAGRAEEGMMSWVTRSKIMGYPDVTTARQQGESLTLWARQRFGSSDFGVNAARLQIWRKALTGADR